MIFIVYLSKMIVISGFLYGYYCVFLRNQPFHFYNRFYLIGMVFISLVLPLVTLPVTGLAGIKGIDSNFKLLSAMKIWHWEEAITITPGHSFPINYLTFQRMAFVLYVMAALIPLYRFLTSILYIKRISRQYACEKIGVVKVFKTAEPGTPFSFFKQIFWNRELDISTIKGQQIFRHEMYHVKENHSVDIVLIELAMILFWFNPFFYLVKKESKATHEFLADQYAISGNDKYEYAELLVCQSALIKQAYIHNYFFHNQIKRRITMITQFKKNRYNFIRMIMAFPLLLILFCAFTFKPKNKQGYPSALSKNYNLKEKRMDTTIIPTDAKIYKKVEIESEFPGGQTGWTEYLIKNVKYPQEALDSGIMGDVVIRFIVDQGGNISQVEALFGSFIFRKEAIRVVQNSGKWIPAVQNGQKVKSYKIQPIKFRLGAG